MPAFAKNIARRTLLAGLSLAAFGAQATTFEIGCTGSAEDIVDLAAAIDFANDEVSFPGPDVIELAAGCEYRFESANNFWYGPNALPPIQSAIAIEGHGATLIRDIYLPFSAGASFRFFYVSGGIAGELPAGQLTLHDLTLSNGLAKGGDTDHGGAGAGMGGAIFNQGVLHLDAVTLTGNHAWGGSARNGSDVTGGGGMGQDGFASGNGGGFGGALVSGPYGGAGAVAGNSGAGGGGGFVPGSGDAVGSTGGGLGNLGGAGGHAFFPSVAGDGGGGANCSSLSRGGDFGSGGQSGGGSCGAGGGVGGGGGAGFVAGGGGFGGGGGSGNTGGSGGFGGGGGESLASSAPGGFGGRASGGGAGMGGAIFNHVGTVTLVNCTLTDNHAWGGSGASGERASAMGAAIFNLNGVAAISYSTIAQNEVDGSNGSDAGKGAGDGTVYSVAFGNNILDGTDSFATLTISNSIIFGTLAVHGAGANDVVNNAVAGNNPANAGNSATLTFAGANIVGAANNLGDLDAGSTVPLTADPLLAPLAANGASNKPFTMAISTASPAFDSAAGGCAASDARGVPRPQFAQCDIGAFEYALSDDRIFSSGFD